VSHEISQPLNNSEPEPQALTPVPLWISQLLELYEYIVEPVLRNANAGVMYLNAQIVATASGGYQYSSF